MCLVLSLWTMFGFGLRHYLSRVVVSTLTGKGLRGTSAATYISFLLLIRRQFIRLLISASREQCFTSSYRFVSGFLIFGRLGFLLFGRLGFLLFGRLGFCFLGVLAFACWASGS